MDSLPRVINLVAVMICTAIFTFFAFSADYGLMTKDNSTVITLVIATVVGVMNVMIFATKLTVKK
jgi:hypothetical protein